MKSLKQVIEAYHARGFKTCTIIGEGQYKSIQGQWKAEA